MLLFLLRIQKDGWDNEDDATDEDREEFRKFIVDCHKAAVSWLLPSVFAFIPFPYLQFR